VKAKGRALAWRRVAPGSAGRRRSRRPSWTLRIQPARSTRRKGTGPPSLGSAPMGASSAHDGRLLGSVPGTRFLPSVQSGSAEPVSGSAVTLLRLIPGGTVGSRRPPPSGETGGHAHPSLRDARTSLLGGCAEPAVNRGRRSGQPAGSVRRRSALVCLFWDFLAGFVIADERARLPDCPVGHEGAVSVLGGSRSRLASCCWDSWCMRSNRSRNR